MVDIDPLYELVQLITDFLPVLIIIAVVLFFITLLFLLIPARGKLANKLRIDKRMIVPMLMGLTLLLSFNPAGGAPSQAIAYDASSVFGGTVMTVELTSLTVNTEYTIAATANTATFNNVTFIASSTTEFVPVPVLDEADGYYLNLVVSTSGQGAATASVWVAPRAIADFLPTEFFFDAMVPIILIVIIVGIAVAVRGGVGGRNS